MKLKPRQIIGLFAIVVFGGCMVLRLTQPSEREIMEKRLASLPTITPTISDLPPLDLSVPVPVAPLDLNAPASGTTSDTPIWMIGDHPDYLNVGSQAAKDDMYCAGVLAAEFAVRIKDSNPDLASLLLRDHEALDKAGLARLVAEGVTAEQASAGFSLAYADKAEKDHTANTLRIPVADCSARAAALN